MKYKISEQVHYKGGTVNFGEDRALSPIKTYVWKHIDYGDKQLYIIQHNQGEPIAFFEANKLAFGENISFEDLKHMLSNISQVVKFAYVWENELEPIVSTPAKPIEPVINSHNSPLPSGKINIGGATTAKPKEDLKPLDEYLEDGETAQAPQQEDQVYTQNNVAEKSLNLITPENIDVTALHTAVPKPQKYYFIRMGIEFHIEKPGGMMEQGNAGDYLVYTQTKKLSILTEEEFNERFQAKKDLITKVIGKEKEEFLLNPKVANYIDFIEKQEIKQREELYLKRKSEKEAERDPVNGR